MNSLCLIIYYTFLTVIIFLINELLINIFDPSIQTKNMIHKLFSIIAFCLGKIELERYWLSFDDLVLNM